MPPRRTTLTYSSEDAAPVDQTQVFVYYCKFSGKHAITTDCNLNKAPRRRTDHALVVDTNKYTVKLYTADGGVKYIKRSYLYILDNALTTYSAEEGFGQGGKQPVPPCILSVGPHTSQIALEIDDRGNKAMILKVSADYVRVQIKSGITHPAANEELLEYMRTVLGVRLSQLSLTRGESTRHKLLRVDELTPDQLFEKVQLALQGAIAAQPFKAGGSGA
ncbi:hypothetical protein N2152v2_005424 [Parachlorella kessleri]